MRVRVIQRETECDGSYIADCIPNAGGSRKSLNINHDVFICIFLIGLDIDM